MRVPMRGSDGVGAWGPRPRLAFALMFAMGATGETLTVTAPSDTLSDHSVEFIPISVSIPKVRIKEKIPAPRPELSVEPR